MQHSSIFNALVKQTQDIPVAEQLLQVTNAHPYFTPAQFYLLQQMNNEEPGYKQQAAKTAILFNNPYWLQFQLQEHQQIVSPVKETPVIPMYAENTDNDDDSALLVHSEEVISPTPVILPETSATIEQVTTLPHQSQHPEPIEIVEPGESAETPMPDITLNLAASIKEAENENALSFEPMHLVDYFASQGIKLSDEVQTADKLGKQLKSFTEWLKTMKKVHVAETETSTAQADIMIQTLAEKSNTRGEIVTEAMAEVFAQQGKAGKAIEVYKKLSLLNPLKSAFFAAKIEQLKGS